MKLHFDEDAFRTLLLKISDRTGIRSDILEKDYYVTLMLKELAQRQVSLPAYFKGGTALYKALGSIKRFSEDIDLTVSIEGVSTSQGKRRLEKAANGYSVLPRDKGDMQNENRKGSITSVYSYSSVVSVDTDDALQRFERIKVEATSFTVSKPFEDIAITAMLYDKSTDEERRILSNMYDVYPFSISTISLERIFVDKLFAAEFYWKRESYFDAAKHIYDICELFYTSRIKNLFMNAQLFSKLIGYKCEEEKERMGSELADKRIFEFEFFTKAFENPVYIKEYERMQNNYVFDEKDKKSIDDSKKVLTSVLLSVHRLKEDL